MDIEETSNQTSKHQDIESFNDDLLFGELQAAWDASSRRMDQAIEEAAPVVAPTLNIRRSRPYRHRVMAEYLVLFLVGVGICVFTAVTFKDFIADKPLRITGYLLFSIIALSAVYCLIVFIAFLIHNPSRTGVIKMSRFYKYMHMQPRYAPQMQESESEQLPAIGYRPRITIPQISSISVAAMFALFFVSCSSSIGDGYTMTQDHSGRIEVVDNVTDIINSI